MPQLKRDGNSKSGRENTDSKTRVKRMRNEAKRGVVGITLDYLNTGGEDRVRFTIRGWNDMMGGQVL